MQKFLAAFLFTVTLALHSADAAGSVKVECEEPLFQHLERTLPLLQSGLDYNKTTLIYRGTKSPQFDDTKTLRYLFHDPFLYSSSVLLENGKGGSIFSSFGTWENLSYQNEASDTVSKKFMDRYDDVLLKTSTVNSASTEAGHPVWRQGSFSSDYDNTSRFYYWVQFASPVQSTAQSYGQYVIGMHMPNARMYPVQGSWETVIPLLIAPWEVFEMTLPSNTVLKKVFSQVEDEENRCVVDYLEVQQRAGAKPVAYLSLCEENDVCESDATALDGSGLTSNMVAAIQNFKMNAMKIAVTRTRPTDRALCSKELTSAVTSVTEFESYLQKRSANARTTLLRKMLAGVKKSPAPKCLDEFKAALGIWKQVPSAEASELLTLGFEFDDGLMATLGVEKLAGAATAYRTFEDLLENYWVNQTSVSRDQFLSQLIALMKKAPPIVRNEKRIAQLEAM